MKIYPSIENLVNELPDLDWDASFYFNRDEWNENPFGAKIMCLTAVEEDEMEIVESEHDDLPVVVVENEMQRFFDVETMRDIITVQKRNHPDSTVEDYVKAINHYSEYDAFLTE
jgi:hypothetical protein